MGKKKTLVRDFTEGSIPKQLFDFMLPVMASNALQVLYSAVDMMVVGHYVGTGGLSAVSVCGQVMNLLTMFCTGLCTGGQVLIAQMIGAKKKRELNQVIGTLCSSILLMAAALSVIIFSGRGMVCTLLNMPSESFDMAMSYLGVCGAGLIFSYGYNMVSAILRGMGDSRRPFVFVTLASVLNLILDVIFVGSLGWSVAGAAAATIIGQAVSFLLSVVYLMRHREAFGFDFHLPDWRIRSDYLRLIVSQGLPMAISSSMIYFSMFYVNSLINRAGVVASATFGVGLKIDDICNKISMGVRYAATPMIAQNYAAGDKKRVISVIHWSWIYCAVYHGCFMVIYLVFGRQLFGLFTQDPDVLLLAPVFITHIIWTFIPTSFLRGTNAFIQGIGNAKLSMVTGLIDGVLCRISLSYLFGVIMDMGFAGFVLGYGLAPFGALTPALIYFFSGVWKKRQSLVDQLGKRGNEAKNRKLPIDGSGKKS